MISILALTLCALSLFYVFGCYQSFARHLAAAKASNIPYVVVPVYHMNRMWLVTQRIWIPYIRKLPARWVDPWIDLVRDDHAWNSRYTTYKKLGDTYITVSPGGNTLSTADASVISQITTRRNDFPKPVEMYGSLNMYGKNVVTTEGQEWRHHRKITSPSFAEKNNHLVWMESLHQAQAMVKGWIGEGSDRSQTVDSISEDAKKLSLHIISRAGFGVRSSWSGAGDEIVQGKDDEGTEAIGDASSTVIDKGHSMSYDSAMSSLLDNVIFILLLPKILLSVSVLHFIEAPTDSRAERLPFRSVKNAYDSYTEWGKYMNEIYQSKKAEVISGAQEQEGLDLMGALVKGAGFKAETEGTSSSLEKGRPLTQTLTDDDILGNAFVFILAGHETTANAIHFSLIFLATKVASQRHLQNDLDRILQGRPVSEWDYEREISHLCNGMAGAVMNETLRLVPPVTMIPKSATKNQDQPLNIDGKKCVVPAGSYINLNSVAAHRNPKYWPTEPPSDPEHPIHPTSNTDNDLEEFRPERWLVDADPSQSTRSSSPGAEDRNAETSDLGLNTAEDTSSLFHPPKGAYIPFSEGYRACLGRRFAQVEVLTVLAVVFSQYSVELAVDQWATDEEVENMSAGERRNVWDKARREVERLMRDGMGSIFTLQMRGGKVPVRFVKRGGERFDGL